MASPAKRRKTNTGTAKPVRGLDFFFNKQKADGEATGKTITTPALGDVVEQHDVKEETDEELARRLQEEWNRADGADAGELGELGVESKVDQEHTSPALAEGEGAQQAHVDDTTIPGDATTESATNIPQAATSTSSSTSKNTLGLQTATAAEDTITYTIPLDQSPLTFDPEKYVTQLQAQWASETDTSGKDISSASIGSATHGRTGSATYALLTHAFVLVGSTTSRIKTVDTLVNLLRLLIIADPDSLLPAVWLATNSISPPYIDLELGLGGSAISRALKKVCGLDNAGLKTLYNKYGDAGDVAFEAKKRQSLTLRKPKPLSIKSVYESLVKIANSKGTGSVEAKQRIVERLVQDARGAEESRYIVRTLVQHVSVKKILRSRS